MNIKKYKGLLSKLSKIDDKEALLEVQSALSEDNKFIKFLENTYDFTHEEHDGLLKVLDLPKNETGYYIDKYGRGVSYNGNRSLKKPKTELGLNKLHEIENKKCSEDFLYFRYNYCFIMTKEGLARPESRSYQKELEESLSNGDDLAILFSRQSGKCATKDTYIDVRNGDIELHITMETFHNMEKIEKYFEPKNTTFTKIKDFDKFISKFKDYEINDVQKEKIAEVFEIMKFYKPKASYNAIYEAIKRFLEAGLEDNYILRIIKVLEYNELNPSLSKVLVG